MISGTNKQLQQQLKYTIQKPDCHSWWISKMQSGREEERYAIKFCLKLGKKSHVMKAGSTAMARDQETEFPVEACWLSQIQEGQTEQIHLQTFDDPFFWQHWHELHAQVSHWTDNQQGILCWGFKAVQEEFRRKRPELFKETIEEMKWGCDEGHWHAHTRGLPWGYPEVVGTIQQVHFSRRRLLLRGLEFHVSTINKSAHMKNVWKLI